MTRLSFMGLHLLLFLSAATAITVSGESNLIKRKGGGEGGRSEGSYSGGGSRTSSTYSEGKAGGSSNLGGSTRSGGSGVGIVGPVGDLLTGRMYDHATAAAPLSHHSNCDTGCQCSTKGTWIYFKHPPSNATLSVHTKYWIIDYPKRIKRKLEEARFEMIDKPDACHWHNAANVWKAGVFRGDIEYYSSADFPLKGEPAKPSKQVLDEVVSILENTFPTAEIVAIVLTIVVGTTGLRYLTVWLRGRSMGTVIA
jgi:hypothetical protein